MEMLDLFDVNRLPLNKHIVRGEKCPPNEYRQIVHVCIFNDKNEMLIQQRQASKKTWPNYWDISVGGCSIAGEVSSVSAARELFEELGIKYDFSSMRPQLTINFTEGFDDIYLINLNINLSDCVLQSKEVQSVAWASREKIKDMIADESFMPYVPSFVDSLFDLKNHRGVVVRKWKN